MVSERNQTQRTNSSIPHTQSSKQTKRTDNHRNETVTGSRHERDSAVFFNWCGSYKVCYSENDPTLVICPLFSLFL